MVDSDSTSSSDTNRHTRIQKSVLTSKHQELRDKLNFHSIYPYLNSHGLLPTALDQISVSCMIFETMYPVGGSDTTSVELVDERNTLQRKIDKVIAYMPDCGRPNFLDEFIVCLKVSNDGTGDAHRELAETIEKAYKSEMERSVSPERDGVSVTVMHRGSGPRHLFTSVAGKVISSTDLKRCICSCAPIAAILIISVLTITIFFKVPHLSNIAHTPNITASQNVIEIKLESAVAFWIEEANISVNNCDSKVIIVEGKSCSSLPTTHRKGGGYDIRLHLMPIHYLEKSIINVLVTNKDVGPNASIWILNEKDYLESKNGKDIKQECDSFHECPRHAAEGESCCYHTQDYAGRNISHEIMKSGFYFAIPQPFFHISNVSYTAVAYNLDAVVQLPDAKVFPGSAKISDWFKFHSTKCVLLNTTYCPYYIRFSTITVSDVSKRMDILVLALIPEFVLVVLVGTGLVVLCKLTLLKGRWCHAKRCSSTYEEMETSDATALIE